MSRIRDNRPQDAHACVMDSFNMSKRKFYKKHAVNYYTEKTKGLV